MAKSDLDQNYTQQKTGHYFWEGGATRRPADAGCRRDLRPSTSSIKAGRPTGIITARRRCLEAAISPAGHVVDTEELCAGPGGLRSDGGGMR